MGVGGVVIPWITQYWSINWMRGREGRGKGRDGEGGDEASGQGGIYSEHAHKKYIEINNFTHAL